MKSLQEYVVEKLKISKSQKSKKGGLIKVTDLSELKKVIGDKYNKDQIVCDMTDVDVSEMTSMEQAFKSYGFETIDIRGWNTSKVKDFTSMFSNCGLLKEVIGIEDIDTSNATSIARMFSYSDRLKEIDLSSWDVSNVTDTSWMFAACKALKTINLSGWNLENAETLEGMFAACHSLEDIDLSNWSTPKLKRIERMFATCTDLKKIDISSFDLSNINSIYQLCQNCYELETIELPKAMPKLMVMTSAFQECSKLKSIPNIEDWDVSNVKYGDYAFYLCGNLIANLKKWDLRQLIHKTRMFYGAKQIKKPLKKK